MTERPVSPPSELTAEPTNERLREVITTSLTIGEQHKHAIYSGEGVPSAEALHGIEAAKDAALAGIVALNRLAAARAAPQADAGHCRCEDHLQARLSDGCRCGDHVHELSDLAASQPYEERPA